MLTTNGLSLLVSMRTWHTRLEGYWSSYVYFFFSSRRRHTRLQGDWSSDVCSSDLMIRRPPRLQGDWSSDVCSSDRHLVISYAVFCLKKKKAAFGQQSLCSYPSN